jgi:hypothetical protein
MPKTAVFKYYCAFCVEFILLPWAGAAEDGRRWHLALWELECRGYATMDTSLVSRSPPITKRQTSRTGCVSVTLKPGA